MCVTVDIDVDREMIESLKSIVEVRLQDICDECSMNVFIEGEAESMEDLVQLVGETFMNHIFVAAVKAAIDRGLEDEKE